VSRPYGEEGLQTPKTQDIFIRKQPSKPQRMSNNPELLERKLLLASTRCFSASSVGLSPTSVIGRKRCKTASDNLSPLQPSGKVSPGPSKATSDDLDPDYSSDEISDAEEDTLPRDAIPDLEQKLVLGEGHFGIVSSVYCNQDRKMYALKEFEENLSSVSRRDSIVRELELWDSLKHPGICLFYRAWQEDAKLYALMKFCEGSTLDKFVHRQVSQNGFVEEKYLLAAFCDVCSALGYMHDLCLVHMDVKASNICLSRGRAMLTDFDRIRRIGEPIPVTDHAHSAMEVLFEDYAVDCPADIFALGITFLYLAEYVPLPENGEEWYKLRDQRLCLEERHERARRHNSLLELVSQCMVKDPRARPSAKRLLSEPCLQSARGVKIIPSPSRDSTENL